MIVGEVVSNSVLLNVNDFDTDTVCDCATLYDGVGDAEGDVVIVEKFDGLVDRVDDEV